MTKSNLIKFQVNEKFKYVGIEIKKLNTEKFLHTQTILRNKHSVIHIINYMRQILT